MSDYIPQEVIIEILKRLPIEALVRCISVCKSWYSLITSPSFISLHSKQIASTNKSLVLLRDYHSKNPNKELYSLHFDDESFGQYKPRLDLPVAAAEKDMFFRVVGCVNGVVCLSDEVSSYTEIMILWNPSIRKYVTLPYPIFGYWTHGGFKQCVGFGFDAATNDFKVVRVVYLTEDEYPYPPNIEIYEPRVGSWREVGAKGFNRIIDEKSPQVFLHGNVHWVIGCKDEYDFFKEPNSTNLIVSFDLRSEEFGVMNVPDSLNEPQLKQDFCVSVLGESLSLIRDTPSTNGNTCCIWVMKQYGVHDSWSKLFTIDVIGDFWRVFGFRRNGEALVKVSSTHRGRQDQWFSTNRAHPNLLVSFEPKSSQEKLLTEFGNWKSLSVENFVESLALLGVKGVYVPKNESADTISADEDSYDPEDGSRIRGPANLPSAQVRVSWFG